MRRKEIYEELHPETKVGGMPGAGQGKGKRVLEEGGIRLLVKDTENCSFAKDTANKTGKSETVIKEEVRISKLSQIPFPNHNHIARLCVETAEKE